MKATNVLFLMAMAITLEGHAQGFINLDFESAVIVQDASSSFYPNGIYASNALPGWIVSVGATQPSDLLYNTISLGSTSVALLGTNGVPGSLSGAYSVNLYGGTTAASASISQTGLVPAGTQTLIFKAYYFGSPGGTLLVSLGGQELVFAALASGSSYTLYGASVASYAGQVARLTFSAPEGVNNYWTIDDIQFSSQAIPEPVPLSLFALAALMLCGWRGWKCAVLTAVDVSLVSHRNIRGDLKCSGSIEAPL